MTETEELEAVTFLVIEGVAVYVLKVEYVAMLDLSDESRSLKRLAGIENCDSSEVELASTATNLTKSDSARTITMGLLEATGRRFRGFLPT